MEAVKALIATRHVDYPRETQPANAIDVRKVPELDGVTQGSGDRFICRAPRSRGMKCRKAPELIPLRPKCSKKGKPREGGLIRLWGYPDRVRLPP